MDFKEGMIVRIYCENFLTYNKIECYPRSKLNMIIGPNGTGKSSLVNAIVLGLGGKLAVIGRAKQLSAYVKRGFETAKIEIELHSQPRNYIIGRKFNIENKNQWTINGESVSFKQVETVIKNLNIQVDNLCQFLPQDRVQDFAKMDSKQLLENTLKTVGSREIVDLHTSLKELRVQELGLGTQMKSFKQQLDSEKMKVARLEAEVSAIREREEILNSIETVKKKKAWVEFEETDKRKKEVLKDKDRVAKMKKSAEQSLRPFETEIQSAKDEIKNIDKCLSRQIQLTGNNSADVRRYIDETTNADDRLHSIKTEAKQKIEAEKKKVANINKLEEEIRFLEESASDPAQETLTVKKINDIQTNLSKKSREVASRGAEANDLEVKLSELTRTKLRMEGAVEREMSAANKKVQVLSQRFRDAYLAYEWLNQNRDKFTHKIYGPMMLEMNCKEEGAKYVEFLVAQRDQCAFLCENTDDMNKFMKTVRDEMGYRINIVSVTENCNYPVRENYPPPKPIQQIKRFGFWSYVIDQVDGPNPVLNYLCKFFALHKVPIGNNSTNNMTDSIPREINSYFSDTDFYGVKVSKYSGESSSRMVNVRPSSLLSGSINNALIAEYKKNIEKEVNKIRNAETALENVKSQTTLLERQRDELRNQKRSLDQELLNLRTSRSKLMMKKEELEICLRERRVDPEEEREKAKQKIKGVVIEACSLQRNILSKLKTYQDGLGKNLINRLKLAKLQDVLKTKQQASMEAAKKLEECRRMLSNVEEELRIVQRDFKRYQEKALSMTENLSPTDSAFKRKYGQAFSTLPQDLEALEAEVSGLMARADCLAGGRVSVLEEYEKTKKLIENLEVSLSNPEQQLQTLKDEMEEKSCRWIPEVMDLIGKINNNFTQFFNQMNCVGEVSLEVPEDKDEYSKYGVCIKVQFRQTGKLQQLGPYTQSGGERAVSTAIYMLSLQELTTVPFRCVDEINQGMDEFNERVVFSLMVHTVEKANSAQCFLLTPKVLRGLEYSSHVHCLCIYSGVHSTSYLEFSRKYILDILKTGSVVRDKNKRASLKRKLTQRDSESESDNRTSDSE